MFRFSHYEFSMVFRIGDLRQTLPMGNRKKTRPDMQEHFTGGGGLLNWVDAVQLWIGALSFEPDTNKPTGRVGQTD